MKTSTTKEHKQKRKQAQKELGSYRSLKLTWKRFDCGLSDDGLENACEECVVCRYRNFLDFAESVGKPEGSTIQYNNFIDKYIKLVY